MILMLLLLLLLLACCRRFKWLNPRRFLAPLYSTGIVRQSATVAAAEFLQAITA
jgi:hypothetical protein